MNYKLISFDMFQTLVDLDSQKNSIMIKIFGNKYNPNVSDQFWNDANLYVYSYFHEINNKELKFEKIISIFEKCYSELFKKYEINMKPKKGAYILAKAHNDAAIFPGAQEVLRNINAKYNTCLISDADKIMIKTLSKKFKFNKVYYSEKMKCYKFDKNLISFKKAIKDFNIEPSEMIHIGDGSSDIIGAKMSGADAIWINKNKLKWKHDIKPDYVIRDISIVDPGNWTRT